MSYCCVMIPRVHVLTTKVQNPKPEACGKADKKTEYELQYNDLTI